MTRKLGLALSGGGARGLAHIGVLKVLEHTQIPIHALAGTSMGGIIAAAYAAGRSPGEIEEVARSLRPLDILQRGGDGLGLIGHGKLADLMEKLLGGDLTFDELEMPLALVAVDLQTGEEVVLDEGSVVKAMLATSALPLLFPPVDWDGQMLADGGLLNNLPCDIVIRLGVDRLVAVHVLPDLSGKPGESEPVEAKGADAILRLLLHQTRWAPLVDIIERSNSIMSRRLVKYRLAEAPPDLLIKIKLKNVRMLDLYQVDRCIKAGEEAALQHVDRLVKLRDEPTSRVGRWWKRLTRSSGR